MRVGRGPRPAPPRQEVGDQLGDVLLALAQRRQLDRHDREPIVEILAKLSVADELPEVLVGRRQDAHVDLDEHVAADRLDLALLDHAQQLVLHLGRDVADLVEEERAARRLAEQAAPRPLRAGEGALLVAEQLRLDQRRRQRRAVEGHERPVARASSCGG